jgi:predicted ATPase/class 3 adenylate cyclase/tetratricopeptide (TPR) repeat protein
MSRAAGTVTFLFTDIEGSTALLTRLGAERYAQVLVQHHQVIRAALAEYGGVEVGTQGDSFFAMFDSTTACAASAIAIQRSLIDHEWPDGEHVHVRMGIHAGEALDTAVGPVSFDVHRAARVAGVAHGGQVLLSEAAGSLLRDSPPEGTSLEDLGPHLLRDLGRPEHLFQLNAPDLPRSFAPLRSLDSPMLRHNLPIQLTSFVGRERELADVRRLLEEGRLITVVGPGGSGKTRVVLQTAAELLDGSGDGVWLVDLAPLDSDEQVAREAASVFKVHEVVHHSLLETLVGHLRHREVLMILDNCEHVVDAAARLAEAIVRSCPKVWVLATSREPLGVAGERVYRLPPLSVPEPTAEGEALGALLASESVRLFVERAREQQPDFSLDPRTGPSIASICRRLDGIPLALELAAARVGSMSVQDLEQRLERRFRLLRSTSHTAVARQQTLEATLSWSYELLNGVEQLFFASLSVFPASFDLAAAEAVGPAVSVDVEEPEVVDLVRFLVDKSLLQIEQAATGLRYRMLETVAEYAAARLAELGEEVVRRVTERHGFHFLTLAEEAAPHLTSFDQDEWVARLDADYDNLRSASTRLADSPDLGIEALRMVAGLRQFWQRSRVGTVGDALELATYALEHPGGQSATSERSAALIVIGDAKRILGDIPGSRAVSEEGLTIARQTQDPQLTATHLIAISMDAYRAGQHDEASAAAAEAFEIASTFGDPNVLARAHQRVALSLAESEFEEQRAHFQSALRLYEGAGNISQLSNIQNALGNVEQRAGNVDAARSHYEDALRTPSPSLHSRAVILNNLAGISRLEGDTVTATSYAHESLQISVRLSRWLFIPAAILELALCTSSRGDLETAAQLHGAVNALDEAHGTSLNYADQRGQTEDVERLRAAMSDGEYERWYARGREMNMTTAIDLALSSGEDQR